MILSAVTVDLDQKTAEDARLSSNIFYENGKYKVNHS